MQIIIRENRQILSARVGNLVRPETIFRLKDRGFDSPLKLLKKLNPDETAVNPVNIESLITSINLAQSESQLPDIIRFNYNSLEKNQTSIQDLSASIRLSYQLAAQRLNIQPKSVILTGVCKEAISFKFKEELDKNNFVGGIMGIYATSIEEVCEMSHVWKKDHSFWDKRAVLPEIKKPDQINLTFRQEQILQLIRTRGLTNVQIANMLKLSESTVKMHVGIILKKYGFRTRMQLVTNLY
jgi:DNA-binding CsgD family transcriptional regulator